MTSHRKFIHKSFFLQQSSTFVVAICINFSVVACQGGVENLSISKSDLNIGSMSSKATVILSSINYPDTSDTVKIVSSMPMTGETMEETQSILLAIKQVIEEHQTVCNGKLKIKYEMLDDADTTTREWEDAAQVTLNAKKVAEDKQVVAFLGPYGSPAAKLTIPILNKANLVLVSPSSTYPGLTKPDKGEGDEPNLYYPNRKRNYARVVPADDVQGENAAKWAERLGFRRIYVLHDQGIYGKGLARVFAATAKKNHLDIIDSEGIDPKSIDYTVLMQKIKEKNPDLIYFGGTTQQNNAGQLVKDMRKVGMTKDRYHFMGGDGIFKQSFIDAAGPENAEGVYATGGIPANRLIGKGADWYRSYKAKYRSEPETFAAYGYESAMVVVKAIDRVCKRDRTAIRDAVFSTRNFEGILGEWSFDQYGDTTSTKISGNIVKDGRFEFQYFLDKE